MLQTLFTNLPRKLRSLNRSVAQWVRLGCTHPTVLGVMAAILVIGAAVVGERIVALMHREQELREVTLHMHAVQARLQTALNRRISLVEGVRAYVLRDHHEIDRAQFGALAAHLIGADPAVRLVALAPDSVISLVHPVEGNEVVLLHDLLQDAQQFEAVRRAILTNETVLAGPYDLMQGGTGLIARKAIYIGQEGPARGRYWGLAMVVFDPVPIFAEAGLVGDTRGIRFSLRGRDGEGERGDLFFGRPLPDVPPLVTQVEVPGGTWQLTAQPELGWPIGSPGTPVILLAGVLLAGLTGALVASNLRRQQESSRLQVQSEEADRRRQESDQKYRSLFEHHSDGVAYLDLDGRVVAINPAASRLLGYSRAELLGTGYRRFVLNWDRLPVARRKERVLKGKANSYEVVFRHRDGRERHLQMTTVPIFVGGRVVGAYEIAKDMTDYKRAEAELTNLAFYDPVTGLANRTLFMKHLERALSPADGEGARTAVLYMDLDRFKEVNDTYGHEAGDRLLQAVALRLRHCIRPGDTLARLAGDEFTLLLPRTGVRGAARVAGRILAACREPLAVGAADVAITPSIGIAAAQPGSTASELLRQADFAMYRAKRSRRGQIKLYRPERDDGVSHLTDLPDA